MESSAPSTAKTKNPNSKRSKPRLVAVREYGGRQSMKKAFKDVIEYRAGVLFDEWRERQDVSCPTQRQTAMTNKQLKNRRDMVQNRRGDVQQS